jgi:DNA-binding response OmpR family regulator
VALLLIVEDYASLRKIYSIAAAEAGHKFMLAKDGTEALKQATENTPDLILLDLLMPVVNGMEFLRKYDLKKHPQTKVIVFTNMDSPGLRHELSELGANLYLVKSEFTPKELMRVIEKELQSPPADS